MAYENSVVSMRSPHSFEPLVVMRVGSMTLLRKTESTGSFEQYEPEALSVEQFITLVKDHGEVSGVEQYVSHTTALPVLRGIVKSDEGNTYFFCVQLDYGGNIELEMARLQVRCIRLSLG